METLISLGLYIITFFVGFFLDKNQINSSAKKAYIIWLYIFLCFGYMTGSDWRGYEITFNDLNNYASDRFLTEPGFTALFYFTKVILGDFFLAIGVLKCIYLFTLIKFLKQCTRHYILAATILLPISSLFILIDNPLRFMTALTIVNVALIYLVKDKLIICYGLLIVAILFHSTTIFFLLLPIIIKNSDRIYSISSIAIVIIYIGVTYISSNVELIASIQRTTIGFLLLHMEMKDYTQSYLAVDNDAFFTLGSMMRIGIFIIVILSKRIVNSELKWEKTLYGMSICYLILERILIIIPTGFRLSIPFGYFYALYLSLLLIRHSKLGYLIAMYLFLMMCKNIYTGYTYLPYTNSIYYIITRNHESYNIRSQYNFDSYQKRMGHNYEQK